MKHQTLHDALEHIDDTYISQAAKPKKRSVWKWTAPIAATLVLAILLGSLFGNQTVPNGNTEATHTLSVPYQVAAPIYPELVNFPMDPDAPYEMYELWIADSRAQYDQPEGYADSAQPFFSNAIGTLLSAAGDKNLACSPVNIYMALAMVGEITQGQSQQQILDALGLDSTEALQAQVGHIWNAHYRSDGIYDLTLANSVWLDESVVYNATAVERLAQNYYASVFQAPLGASEADAALQAWINEQTHGLLKTQAAELSLPPQTLLTLASTVYYQCRWQYKFHAEDNTTDLFYSPAGDMPATYMHQDLGTGLYVKESNYAATYLSLESGGKMWLILPDEDTTVAQVAADSTLWEQLRSAETDFPETATLVHLSIPKFDVSANLDLDEALKTLGITQVFTDAADFSPILPENDARITGVNHAARVCIDEEGVTAVGYTVMAMGAGGPMITDEVELVLNRPFLFIIESTDGLPLFAGVVNQPQ